MYRSVAREAALCADAVPGRSLPPNAAIGLVSFLTLVDLFAAQAILPMLAASYGVAPSEIGVAVNASTLGMAAAGLAIAVARISIDRRRAIAASLALLAIPTALLALQPGLWLFALLRIVQGVFMSAAFTLTMAHLAERAGAGQISGALAAYVTGNVASNLLGRFAAAAIADAVGVERTFVFFAALNVLGAAVVLASFRGRSSPSPAARASFAVSRSPMDMEMRAWARHLRNGPLLALFGIGFLILFAFVGTFSYVNFVLVEPPLSLRQMTLGAVYLVFVPALVLTPLAGRLSQAFGPRSALRLSFGLAAAALPLLVLPSLAGVLAGLALLGAGTFAAQAIVTALVGRLALEAQSAASGLYLAAYYLGGLAGSAILGRIYDHAGWPACVATIGLALIAALVLTARLPALSPPVRCPTITDREDEP